jgi:hypothetical protein
MRKRKGGLIILIPCSALWLVVSCSVPRPQAPPISMQTTQVSDQCVIKMNFDFIHKPVMKLFDWGDGSFSEGEFPQEYTYRNTGVYGLTVSTAQGGSRSKIMALHCD